MATMVKEGGLTPQQLRFVQCYMCHKDKARAAREANYGSPQVMGSKLTDPDIHPNVCRAIEERERELAAKMRVTSERVIAELAAVAFFDQRELFNEDGTMRAIHELPSHVAAAIQSFEMTESTTDLPDGPRGKKGGKIVKRRLEAKAYNKLEALKMLAVHLGLLKADGGATTNVNVATLPWDLLMGGRPAGPNSVNERVERLIEEAERGRVGGDGSGSVANARPDETLPPPTLDDVTTPLPPTPPPLPGTGGGGTVGRNGHG